MLSNKAKRYLIGKVRLAWRYYSEERKECIKQAKGHCSLCKKRLKSKGNIVDHKIPVVSISKGFEGWDTYISRMFCSSSNLQFLCEVCNKLKCEKERKERRKFK